MHRYREVRKRRGGWSTSGGGRARPILNANISQLLSQYFGTNSRDTFIAKELNCALTSVTGRVPPIVNRYIQYLPPQSSCHLTNHINPCVKQKWWPPTWAPRACQNETKYSITVTLLQFCSVSECFCKKFPANIHTPTKKMGVALN